MDGYSWIELISLILALGAAFPGSFVAVNKWLRDNALGFERLENGLELLKDELTGTNRRINLFSNFLKKN